MKAVDTHLIISSFKEWLQHHVLNDLEAFKNIVDQELFLTNQPELPNYRCYAAPSKQWIYDGGVTNAIVVDTVEMDGVEKGREDGIIFDYNNGQILIDEDNALEPDLVTASYSLKEINFYISTKADHVLVFGENEFMWPEFAAKTKGLKTTDVAAPLCFVKYKLEDNDLFCFGGTLQKKYQMRTVFMLKTEHQLVGIGKLCADLKNTCFNILSKGALQPNGDIRDSFLPEWNFVAQNVFTQQSNVMRVDDVVPSIIESDNVTKLHPDMLIIIVDFYLSRIK